MGAATGQRQPLLARYRAALSRVKQHELLHGLACASLLGFIAGLVVRSLILAIALIREVSRQGYGLTHIVLGLATGYGVLHESQRKAALQLAAFFTSYELGEWPLGDPPFQELRGYALGIALGLLVGIIMALYRWAKKRGLIEQG